MTTQRQATSPADRLRELLARPGLLLMVGCYDALSAKLVERAGFPLTFMSGFSVSAARLGLPDTGLLSYGESVEQARSICAAVSIPVLGDGDTGYGNPINVKRTVRGYADAGMAAVMIEDQVWPKRCGHTPGKKVVSSNDALARIQAAVDARNEGADILILARTDAHYTDGLPEAIRRAQRFAEIGADILFVEAPTTEVEIQTIASEVPGPKMVNLIEQGETPLLPLPKLEEFGYKIAVFPLTLLMANMYAMQEALSALKEGRVAKRLLDFSEVRTVVGFPDYYQEEVRYATDV
ncbi:MAG: isocitrate lyase/PEP mutase family protein [candidate division NC10 bacterium]